MDEMVGNESLPSISIVIPTLNCQPTLALCLDSIIEQDYPAEKIEVIVADGGSSDATLAEFHNFAGRFRGRTKNLFNDLKTGEAGKAVGINKAEYEIVALIDSDNILPTSDWLRRMVEPFSDPEIIASEPIEYGYRPTDGFITRYCALLGMNDPLCLFLGNYDRLSVLTGKWTEMPVKIINDNNYYKIILDPRHLPTIGANGFLVRRSLLTEFNIDKLDYFFDIDFLYEVSLKKPLKIAKVKNSIIHLYSTSISGFARKQRRRVRDYMYYNKQGLRSYPWKSLVGFKLFKFLIYTLTILPLFAQSLIGYSKKRDNSWWFHPIACWITLWEYSIAVLTTAGKPLPRE